MASQLRDWIWKNRQKWPLRRAPAVPIGEEVEKLREGAAWLQAGPRSSIEEAVREALAPALREHVFVGGVKAGELLVFVDDPAYRFVLRNYWYTRLLGAVRRLAPEAKVHDLRFELEPRAGVSTGFGWV